MSSNELQILFANNVRNRRMRLGMTQQEVAARASIPQSFMSYLERGQRVPSFETIAALAEALGTTPEKLFREPKKVAAAS